MAFGESAPYIVQEAGGGLDVAAYLDTQELGTWLGSPDDSVSFSTGKVPVYWSDPPAVAELNGAYYAGRIQDNNGLAEMEAGTHHWNGPITTPQRWSNCVGVDSLGELIVDDGGWIMHYDPATNTETTTDLYPTGVTEMVHRTGTTEVILFDLDGVKVYDYNAGTLTTVDATGYNGVGAGYDPVDDVIRGVRDRGYTSEGINYDSWESFVWDPSTQSEVQSAVIMNDVNYPYAEFATGRTDSLVCVPMSSGIGVLNHGDETWTEYTGWGGQGYATSNLNPVGSFVKNGICQVFIDDNSDNTTYPLLVSRGYQ